MLYSEKDISILTRLIIRKGYEIATSTMDSNLTESQRHSKIDHLLWQLSKSRIMISIGLNDLSDIHLNLHILETDVPNMSESIYVRYLEGLNPRDRGDEAHFAEMDSILSSNVPLIISAIDMSSDDSCGITESDLLLLGRINRQTDDERISVICRTLLRIGSLKRATGEELSYALDGLNDLHHQDLNGFDTFMENRDRYRIALFARCIINSHDPELACISDHPFN